MAKVSHLGCLTDVEAWSQSSGERGRRNDENGGVISYGLQHTTHSASCRKNTTGHLDQGSGQIHMHAKELIVIWHAHLQRER